MVLEYEQQSINWQICNCNLKGMWPLLLKTPCRAFYCLITWQSYRKKLWDVALEILRLSRDRYRYVQTRKSYGSAGTFDVLQAENNYLTDSSNALRQQLNYENALRNLNLVLSEPIEKQYYLRSEFDIDNNIRDFVLADLIAKLEK
jgi:outer membrane protein TolC